MAEVAKAVPEEKLEELLERIIADGDKSVTPPKYNRIKWNKEIQNLCFNAIESIIEKHTELTCRKKVELGKYWR